MINFADMTPEKLSDAINALIDRIASLEQRVVAAEAWICRRPGDAIPQPFIDQIAADAIAGVTPPQPEGPEAPSEPTPEVPAEEPEP